MPACKLLSNTLKNMEQLLYCARVSSDEMIKDAYENKLFILNAVYVQMHVVRSKWKPDSQTKNGAI